MPFSDFSRFSRCLSVGLHIGLPLRGIPMRPPGVSDESFPLCCRMYLRGSVQLSDFAVARQLIHLSDLLCASCSSAQGFAYAFLQIPPHDGHPWPRLTVPAVGPVKSFHLLGSSHAQHTCAASRLRLRLAASPYGSRIGLPHTCTFLYIGTWFRTVIENVIVIDY